MKKLILLCLLSLTVKSQVQTGTVILVNAQPNEVCRGENLTITFKFKGIHDPNKWFSFYYEMPNLAAYPLMFVQCDTFYTFNKTVVNSDTIYSFVHNIPPTIPYGVCQLKVAPDHNFPGRNLTIKNCGITGIEELEQDESKPIYYDLQGNIIEPRSNELIIKQVGHKRFKVIIE